MNNDLYHYTEAVKKTQSALRALEEAINDPPQHNHGGLQAGIKNRLEWAGTELEGALRAVKRLLNPRPADAVTQLGDLA